MEEQSINQSEETFSSYIIKKLHEELPVVFSRSEIAKLLGGTISAGTLANLGKKGPKYVLIENKAIYERTTFLEWLNMQIKNA